MMLMLILMLMPMPMLMLMLMLLLPPVTYPTSGGQTQNGESHKLSTALLDSELNCLSFGSIGARFYEMLP